MSGTTDPFRVLTWNIHGCIGKNGAFDPQGVARTITRIAPHIVALQEVDARQHIAGGFDTFGYLSDTLGGESIVARTIETDQGDYGHMLISRCPVVATRLLDLSFNGREPRCAIAATLAAHDIQVIAAHLGLRGRERRHQIGVIRDFVAESSDRPGVVLGDFNDWRWPGLTTRMLCPPFRPAAAMPTFPSALPLLALDRIWCRPPLVSIAARVVKEARHLSDHLPVLAELRLGNS